MAGSFFSLCIDGFTQRICRHSDGASSRIDPDGAEGMTPRKISKKILQIIGALEKAWITARFYRSNGKRLIELIRADSDDFSGVGEIVTIDPAGVGNARCSAQ